MADSVMPPARANPSDAVREMLGLAHRRNARAPLRLPSAAGVFPEAILVRPRPVIADTNWLGADIHYACLHGKRTTLITAANQQVIRVFCSAHVVEELIEHSAQWSTAAKRHVPRSEFLSTWRDQYLPLIRVVPDDAIPTAWLSPDERGRVEQLEAIDADDVPSVMLAMVVRGLYLSKDKAALRALYGDGIENVEHSELLALLKAGGDAAELTRMLNAGGGLSYAAGYGVLGVGRRIYGSLGPAGVIIAAAAVLVAWRSLNAAARRRVASLTRDIVELAAEVALQQRAREQHFASALPRVPTWEELAETNEPEAVVGRACVHALSREPTGHSSARELATKLQEHVSCSEARVRAVLRAGACFHGVDRGKWQVGHQRLGG